MLVTTVANLSTFSFVNRCGEWHYGPNFFYFHLYKSWILLHSSLSIGVEDDTTEGHSDWTGQISFTFIYTSQNLSTISFVNRCGGWYFWGTFWLNWPNFFYFHVYKAWILVHSALSIGVEDDTIEGHSDRTGTWILVLLALSMGVIF